MVNAASVSAFDPNQTLWATFPRRLTDLSHHGLHAVNPIPQSRVKDL
jgi:hypothetical protein